MSNSVEQMVWSESYRPRKLEDCILPKATMEEARGFVESGRIPHLLLHGSAGTGKTTMARALCDELDYEYIVVNGSNEGRLLDTLRGTITQFASGLSFDGKHKCVILDEADFIPQDTVQPALRNFLDEYGSNCSFIFTANFPNRILEPIQSRCAAIAFEIPATERKALIVGVLSRVFHILRTEGVTFDKKAVASVVTQYFPDFRRVLNELQRISASGTIDETTVKKQSQEEFDALVDILRGKKFTDLRRWVAVTPNADIVVLSRKLFDSADKIFKDDSIPQFILTAADYAYKNSFVVDKEINLVAFLTSIMADCEVK